MFLMLANTQIKVYNRVMKVKKIITAAIILVLLSLIVVIYIYFSKTGPTITNKEPKTVLSSDKSTNLHIMKDFAYTHYKKDRILFSIKAKEHLLTADQRSDFKNIEIDVFNDQKEKVYRITAGEGIITQEKELLILRNNVEIINKKGWKILTHVLRYLTEEEKIEIPHKLHITWENENAKGSALQMNYDMKNDFMKLIDNVMITQEKPGNKTELYASTLSIDEKENTAFLQGEPAQVVKNTNRISGSELKIKRNPQSKEIEKVEGQGDVAFLYNASTEKEKQSFKKIEMKGNVLSADFDESGNISNWNVQDNSVLRAHLLGGEKEKQKSICVINAPIIQGIFSEKKNLSSITSQAGASLKIMKQSRKKWNSTTGNSQTIELIFSDKENVSLSKIIFSGKAQLNTDGGSGEAKRIEQNIDDEITSLKGNAHWLNQDLSIKADTISFNKKKNELKALHEGSNPIQTRVLSKNKKILQSNNNDSFIITSDTLEMKKDVIKYEGYVVLASSKYTIYSRTMEFDTKKNTLSADEIKNLKITNQSGNSNYVLKAKSLFYEQKGKKFELKGNVELEESGKGAKIISDKLQLVLDENDDIKEAIAEDKVKIHKGSIEGSCEKALYNIKNDEITLMKSAQISKSSKNKMHGEKLVLNLKDETILASGTDYQRTEIVFQQAETNMEKKEK
ncbi:MAG: LPS export ABC transporter periplasmic protein LptC [Candidatus Fischerbacteria bacterium RBG_13_37_8]|uniref:LPS export ABC transporter periplasmic protein LptC n=1 Tax=Candidatus Fischerbacteria bacterium RBG_13_37_8 TaxID=1817863 RepID=A0A1F5VSL2_9BACT|nr:MAG: LPS export ABC transporter periplasmic protein LptC [Candidatus Fischerbacteria bacterium RBG_13_37_8]